MYPSEQMFFNAMRRKGWSPREEDMARCALRTRSAMRCLLCVSSVVAIHNTVNERAWREVLAWEVLHHGCGQSARHSAVSLLSSLRAATAGVSTHGSCASLAGRKTTARRRDC